MMSGNKRRGEREENGKEIVKIELDSRDKQEIVHMATESKKNSLSLARMRARATSTGIKRCPVKFISIIESNWTHREVEGE